MIVSSQLTISSWLLYVWLRDRILKPDASFSLGDFGLSCRISVKNCGCLSHSRWNYWCLKRHQHSCTVASGLTNHKIQLPLVDNWSHHSHCATTAVRQWPPFPASSPPSSISISCSWKKHLVHLKTFWMLFRPHEISSPTPGRTNMAVPTTQSSQLHDYSLHRGRLLCHHP